jgi:hypothetical protein
VRSCNPTGFLPSQYELISPPSSYIHNTTTHAFSIVASAPGIPHSYLSSKLYVAVKSHGRQDAGIRIAPQIAIMMGCAVLPHLRNLVPQLPPTVSSPLVTCRSLSGSVFVCTAEITVHISRSFSSARRRYPQDAGITVRAYVVLSLKFSVPH